VTTSPSDSDKRYDIGIIGGGPAGLSAAIWSARYLHSVVVIDSGDPRNWETRGVNGYLGLPGICPPDLRASGRKECESLGVDLVDASVLRVDRRESGEGDEDDEDDYLIRIEGGDTVCVRRVLLAIGMRDYWPDIPGLDKVYGANAHVCPDCDGHETQGKKAVVVGFGKRAVAMALALTTWTSDITICTNGCPPEMEEVELQEKLAANNIPVVTEAVTRLERRGSRISSLLLASGRELDADKLFFTIAQYPADDIGAQLGCDRDRGGHIIITEHHATSVSGVFAAGDITPGPQLAIRAAAGGAVAAMAMHKSLVPDYRKLS
jgi:thioredoxin reductase